MEQLQKIGHLVPKSAAEIGSSRLGIGFEKLDRAVFDPTRAYDKLGAIGAKWARLQSGWQRTERTRGVYDFAWLDEIVDTLIAHGMQPWICLCYGNDLYSPEAKNIFGAVGVPPIFTDDQRRGWAAYVKATVAHFRDRVDHWEIWNEPDGDWCWKHGRSAAEYGRFCVDTAAAIRAAQPEATVIGGVVCMFATNRTLEYADTALATGMAEAIDVLSYHSYHPDETSTVEPVRALRALAQSYNPHIRIMQGETGSQSRSDGHGALAGGAWTPMRQAKQCIRHAVLDLALGVELTSYFSCVDMAEALGGRNDDVKSRMDYGYFGLLETEFDETGYASGGYRPKPAYYAYQNACAAFAESPECVDLPILRLVEPSRRMLGHDFDGAVALHGFRRPNGSAALAYWAPTDLLTTDLESTVSFRATHLPGEIRLIDLLRGDVYAIPDALISQSGGEVTLRGLPVTDFPMLLTFGAFADVSA